MIPHFCKSLALFCQISSRSLDLKKPHVCYNHVISALFFSSTSVDKKNEISLFDYLTKHQQFSPETALRISKSRGYVRSPEYSDSVLLFLKDSGFSQIQVEKVVKAFPKVLFVDLENTLRPKFELFKELGFSSDDIAEIVSGDPWVLSRSADNRIGPSIIILKEVLGSTANVTRVLKLSAWFLKHDLEKTMLPSMEYLKSCGICWSQLVKYVIHFPRFFLHKPDTMKYFVSRTDEMGIDRNSKLFLPAMRVFSSMTQEKWKQKVQLFRDLGMSDNDILAAFRRAPQVFAISEKKIENATKTLLSLRNSDISVIVNQPELLIFSVENRLKPRLRVLKILESKNMIEKKPRLSTICKQTEKQFIKKYVYPFSAELEGIYMVNEDS